MPTINAIKQQDIVNLLGIENSLKSGELLLENLLEGIRTVKDKKVEKQTDKKIDFDDLPESN